MTLIYLFRLYLPYVVIVRLEIILVNFINEKNDSAHYVAMSSCGFRFYVFVNFKTTIDIFLHYFLVLYYSCHSSDQHFHNNCVCPF